MVTCRHTRVGFRSRPMRCPIGVDLAERRRGFRPASQRTSASPCRIRARRAKARERLPSYREHSSRDPNTTCLESIDDLARAHRFAFYPFVPPRQAALRTSSRLATSSSGSSCDLPVAKTRDASDRILPPKRTTFTRTSCVPGSWRHFRGGGTSRSLWLHAVYRGTGRFTTSVRPLRRMIDQHVSPS